MPTHSKAKAKTPKKDKGTGGRPTAMTQETLDKLEYAFSIGCTDKEACLFADIAPATLYNYQEANPAFLERKELLKDKPIFQARQAVIKQFQAGDGELALKYLERKKKDEFAPKQTVGLEVSQELAETMSKVKDIYEKAKKK